MLYIAAGRSQIDANSRLRIGDRRQIESKWLPFGAGTVVAEKKDQRVVQFAIRTKIGDQAPDVARDSRAAVHVGGGRVDIGDRLGGYHDPSRWRLRSGQSSDLLAECPGVGK